jgi:hypothetical protein
VVPPDPDGAAHSSGTPRDYQPGDSVEIRSGSSWHGEGELFIGPAGSLSLTPRQFAVLYVLALHLLTLAGKPARHAVKGPPNLSAKDILDSVEALKERDSVVGAVFSTGEPLDITRVISDLRALFRAHRIPRDLVKTGPRRNGYHLEIDPRNLRITLLD